jgi:hypothetical protein
MRVPFITLCCQHPGFGFNSCTGHI